MSIIHGGHGKGKSRHNAGRAGRGHGILAQQPVVPASRVSPTSQDTTFRPMPAKRPSVEEEAAKQAAAEGRKVRKPRAPRKPKQPEQRDMFRELQWVYDHIDEPVTESDAPSPGAYAWLKLIQSDEDAKADFYAKHVPRLIPKPKEEEVKKVEDKGMARVNAAIEMFKRFKAEAARKKEQASP